jgi:hypothetical protein
MVHLRVPHPHGLVLMIDFATLVRFTTALIFAAAALGKLRNPAAFSAAVASYGLLSAGLTRIVGWAVPLAECAIAASLISGFQARFGLVAAGVVLVVFASAGAVALIGGRRPECGCLGGAGNLRVNWISVTVNLVLAAAAASAATQSLLGAPLPLGARSATVTELLVIWMLAPLVAGAYWLEMFAESVVDRLEEALALGSER